MKKGDVLLEDKVSTTPKATLARFNLLIRDQWAETVIHRVFQVLFAAKVAFRCQNRGMTEKKLDLLKFSAV
jgi:hypothetical protein